MTKIYGYPLWSWFALAVIVAALGYYSWAGFAKAVRGVRFGSIRPRPVGRTVYRSKQPIRFWQTVAWSACRGAICATILILIGAESILHGP
jgi:hypothetical protein